MNHITEILIKAKALIADPENWLQDCLSRDESGASVTPSNGCSFCSVGALFVYSGSKNIHKLANLLLKFTHGQGISTYNDTHTHAEVMAIWDKAIEESRK